MIASAPPQGLKVDSLEPNKVSYAPGERVTVTATLSAAEQKTLRQVVVAASPKGGDANFDFGPPQDSVAVGPTPASFTVSRVFDSPGTYEYFVAYYDGNSWHNLAPVKELSVATSAPVPAAPAPAPAPAPVYSPPNYAAPTIGGIRPANGSSTRDRTPAISAYVRDSQTDLAKGNVALFVDGRRVTSFSYNPATDRLAYTSRPLGYGRHIIKVVANDGRFSTSRTWRFTVVR